ncbi:MAG: fumarylacetoacetate hydrolase family protein [Bdellovibrionota bacterium]|nr:MAG: fumarylacetoacetate hydrolase family protein [Bdellovibrionota bacterium]
MTHLLEFKDGKSEPLGTFYCVGRNYEAHAREMGAAPGDAPVIFIKPPSAYLPPELPFRIPAISKQVQHEVELVAMVGGRDDTLHVAAVAVGMDMTLRDLQRAAKERGEPWAVSKGFRGSAPLSPFIRIKDVPCALAELSIELSRDGQTVQKGRVAEMRWGVAELISHIDSIFGLAPGDCIFTGTPDGVGPVHPGERFTASLCFGQQVLTSRVLEVR